MPKNLWANDETISRETILVFSKLFAIHTDASKVKLWAVIKKDTKQTAFYSRKLDPA